MDALHPYLGTLDTLAHTVEADQPYVQPALKNLGTIAIPVLREVIAPAAFRNADPEITDIEVDKVRRVRAVANKFKFGERSRGLQVLRLFGAGGRMPQNRTDLSRKGAKASDGFDLNTFVFGDSANLDKYVLPVKAAVSYSDAVSLAPHAECVDSTFHNRASEDGSLFDAENKENSVNLFERHFIRPGTLLLQVLTLNGKTAPPEALEHLLLAIGLAGAYGGQTSIYGVNVRNHIVGLYAGRLERAVASPYVALRDLTENGRDEAWRTDPTVAITALDRVYSGAYPVRVPGEAASRWQADRIAALENGDATIEQSYQETARRVGTFFDQWFHKIKKA